MEGMLDPSSNPGVGMRPKCSECWVPLATVIGSRRQNQRQTTIDLPWDFPPEEEASFTCRCRAENAHLGDSALCSWRQRATTREKNKGERETEHIQKNLVVLTGPTIFPRSSMSQHVPIQFKVTGFV